jgi:hypothetical protein
MAPNPIACSHRLYFPTVVDGITHHHHLFVHAVAGGTDYQLVHQLSADQDWQDDANHWNVLLAAIYDDATEFGEIELQAYEAGSYVTISTVSPTADAGTAGGTYFPASQLTMIWRDAVLRRVNLVFLESVYGNPRRWVTTGTATAALNAITTDIRFPVGDNDAGFWLCSRSEDFLVSFISGTATDNKQLRRRRGLI